MNQSKISIIIPVYNYAQFLSETIESVLNQIYTNWECIIINDGSTDDTEDIALRFCKKDSRIKYFFKKNGGLSSARNEGLRRSTGSFVLFLDSDDVIHPDKFKKHLLYFDNYPEVAVVYSSFKYFFNNGDQQESPYSRVKLYNDDFKDLVLNWGFEFVIPIHCAIFRSSFIKNKNIWFDESLKAREDWLFWINLSKNGAKYFFIDEYLSFYRKHNTNMANNQEHMIINTLRACFKVHEIIPQTFKIEFETRYSEYLSKKIEESKNNMDLFQNTRLYKLYRNYKRILSLFK